jgi:hypothetical protein
MPLALSQAAFGTCSLFSKFLTYIQSFNRI